jgi:hypothetical protein
MDRPSISYAPRPDTTPETELSTLCNVYKLIIDHAKRNAAGMGSTSGDDATKGSNDDRASGVISDR